MPVCTYTPFSLGEMKVVTFVFLTIDTLNMKTNLQMGHSRTKENNSDASTSVSRMDVSMDDYLRAYESISISRKTNDEWWLCKIRSL